MKILFKIMCLVLLIGGCKTSDQSNFKSPMLDKDGNFVLVVSNQSFAVNPVDICIKIDGILVVDDFFDVGDQHNFIPYVLKLAKGKHKISVSSGKGQASLEQEFDIIDKHWGSLFYWYYPKITGGAGPIKRSFSFGIDDKPLLFD